MSSTSELSGFAARLRGLMPACPGSVGAAAPGALPFDELALELFALQFRHNTPYRRFCEARGAQPGTVTRWAAVPAIPTSAFRELELTSLPAGERTAVFHSSGTMGYRPSRHFHNAESLALYELSALTWFRANCQLPIADCQLAILTPPPVQAPHSSLVHMFETIRRELALDAAPFVGSVASAGAWALEREATLQLLRKAEPAGQPFLLLGTAFAFVHLLDRLTERDLRIELPLGSCAMETGGYKGRSRTLSQTALHALISGRLGIPPRRIVCEYGMSELSSQAYDSGIGGPVAGSQDGKHLESRFPLTPALSLRERETLTPSLEHPRVVSLAGTQPPIPPLPEGEGRGEGKKSAPFPSAGIHPTAQANPERLFRFPPWARAQIISPETGAEVAEGETGLIRVFDLANVYSVMAIQTEDLGIRCGDGFVLTGRAAAAEPRGCSLMAVDSRP